MWVPSGLRRLPMRTRYQRMFDEPLSARCNMHRQTGVLPVHLCRRIYR
jgi:hypothetical protein